MLDSETKRKIDNARDILVGKVPDPKSQVEQITIALIYKFMDDMDRESEELGGKASFFTGEYRKYSWSKIFDPKLGGYDLIALYGEAIAKMNTNKKIPQLFRDIFKNAFLPYRDPETLKSFLKEINDFHYNHSEKLGDAFEYLLSVLGSQGEAGQFRTPRHIIDFIVAVVDPKKGETVLDPAGGTAGFLISSYKHILKSNTSPSLLKAGNNGNYAADLLTPDDRKRIMESFEGYDISPDMVRLSLANLYLHGFPSPRIHEYDTLTSEDRWGESFDVILANPPFMTPKGGIRPHKRFSIQANRSEVLFVDYIAEHLSTSGRAGVIVPEGIIFQSANAYKALRKMLIEQNYLWAVVSLPAGVFNPYSGVKTSILFMDRALAKKTNDILFIKIEHDGFDLGAQRRPYGKNDLPAALDVILKYKKSLSLPASINNVNALIVSKSRIAENGDYNLSGDRYRDEVIRTHHDWPLIELGEVCDVISGQSPEGKYYNDAGEGTPFYQGKTEFTDRYIGYPVKWTTQETKIAEKDDILISVRAPVGPVNISTQRICIGRGLAAIRPGDRLIVPFLFAILKSKESEIKGNGGAAFDSINRKDIESIKIPLPSLEVQKEIVAEIEVYQKIINGARQVVENWRSSFTIDPEWPLVELGELSSMFSGGTPSKTIPEYWIGNIPWVSSKDMKVDYLEDTEDHISYSAISESATKLVEANTLLCVVRSGILQHTFPVALTTRKMCHNQDILSIVTVESKLLIKYLFHLFKYKNKDILKDGIKPGVTVQSFHSGYFKSYKVPLPSLDIQKSIVEKIEEEQKIVESNKRLIEIYEAKIKSKIDEVWGS
jgi:type I restriction enzyme M protein